MAIPSVESQDLEALWSVVFLAPDSTRINAGVIIFETDRMFGGDSWYYYTGTYQHRDGKLTARLKSTHYAGQVGSPAFGALLEGLLEFIEIGRGKDHEGRRTILVQGTVIEPPTGQLVVAELTWREGLPG